jgi:hypothetical protein
MSSEQAGTSGSGAGSPRADGEVVIEAEVTEVGSGAGREGSAASASYRLGDRPWGRYDSDSPAEPSWARALANKTAPSVAAYLPAVSFFSGAPGLASFLPMQQRTEGGCHVRHV